uniref:Cleavage and polyadenylation specificity factor subunit 1 n=3 Tax=Proconiini TaxID=565685 RepID=A0A1B6G369_9HEMI
MYSVCKTTHPATGIEHSITCNFFNRSEKSLVVAGANVIRVLRLIPDVDPNKKKPKNINTPPKMKMECLAAYTLYGNVMSMQSVSLAGSQRDALLLSFRDAKLSVVEYDLDTHDLKTLSLHYFEEEEIRGGWTQHTHIPIIRVDPEGRCAVMLVYGRQLVVLPFRRETILEDGDILAEDPSTSGPQSKAPVLASYMIILKEVEEKMDNIIDIQFLHGYYEPTLLILYEPVKTFSGRIAVRRDTCAMVAISLNIQQRVHPVIWSVSNLPMDCTQALAVRKPLGGTLIFAINSLIYLNQSVPPYGISLNSVTDVSTSFPLKIQENVKMTLEGAQASFISNDRLVLSLKNGELYVLTLHADSMRSVRSFHFEKAAASVLTTCTCVYADNYLFLGSRLGNSLLLKFTEKKTIEGYKPPTIDLTQPPLKKRRMDTLGDWMASDVADIRDLDELEVYGSEAQTSIQLTSYSFEVCDSLLNIGPCGNISMGEPAFLSEEFSNNTDPDVELVTTSGYGKNGALCVLQRSVRPQVVTTFELTGITDMWIVTGRETVQDESQEPTHAFLILSQPESSMILQTGQEINEIDNSGFNTQGPTIYAGNLGSNKYVIQVSQMGVRLLQGPEQIQHMPLDLGSPVVHATSVDPYVFLLTEDCQVVGMTLRETKTSARLIAKQDIISSKPAITAMHAYRDVSGMFSSLLPETDLHLDPEQRFSHENIKREVDDEDELLYGEPGTTEKPGPTKMAGKAAPWWGKYYMEVKATYWLLVTRENGHLEMYSVPDLLLSYLVAGIGQGHRVLSDSLGAIPTVAQGLGPIHDPVEHQIRELMVAPLGNMSSRPLLILRTDDQILLYEAYRFPKGHLKMRFRRIPQSILVKLTQEEKKARAKQEGPKVNQLRYFGNIAGYNGVFVCGNQPHWIFLTFRGELRIHPMTIDGSVTCFAPFNNINCPQGFLYFNQKGELRICVLPTHLSYDASWPVRKVPLRCTPHFITYHLESKTYCLVTSTAEPTNEYYKFNGEDKELSIEERDERFPLPVQERFSVLLFSPVSWEIIPNTKMELEDWEHVTCLKNVSLAYEGTRSGLKGYIALGTNYNYSEDITSRGRILIFDIIEVVPEPGQPLTKNRFKMLYSKEQKGPVTAMTHALGFLVSAVGQKIYIWQLKDNDLVGVAFIDTQIYIHQILSIKSLILVADVYKSITLLRFQEEYRTLSLVSRDFRACEVFNVEFLIDNAHLGFLVSDREKNIVLYMYQPQARESYGGQRLIRKADFHVGQHINTFFRIRCKVGDGTVERRHQVLAEKRHITMFATLDGALGYLLPVPEKSYRRLLMLQNVLVNQVQHTAGLNPKAYRQYKSWSKLQGNPARGVIDGELVWTYLSLPVLERAEIAKKIGTKVDEIIDDLGEIEKVTAHF